MKAQPEGTAAQAVEQALAARPDGFLFVAADADALLPSVRKINAAGIPLASYINRLQGGEWVSTGMGGITRWLGRWTIASSISCLPPRKVRAI